MLAAIALHSSLLEWEKLKFDRPACTRMADLRLLRPDQGLEQSAVFVRRFRRVRDLPAVRPVLNAVAGYRRPFPTFADAAAAIARDEGGGHSNPHSIGLTVRDAKKARPSDYPALFYIQGLLPQIRTVFDPAGGVGNAFYCYSKYIDMPAGLSWRILELPEQIRIGQNLPKGCNEIRLHYAANDRDELIRGFESLGYELVYSWRIAEPEHFKIVTCYPDRSVTAYSGLFLRLNEPRNAPLEQGRDDRAAALPPSARASHYFLLQGKILSLSRCRA